MTPAVAELLRARAGSQRGHRDDPCHLALVVEGGGMRGVVAGGMVSALEERGLLGAFDSIHGSSAGACAGAYFSAGQARLGTRIYYEDINNWRFIDRRRILVGRAIMNTHFLIDHVMHAVKVLDVARIVENPGFLNVVATDANTGESCIYNSFRDAKHFFDVLKGSITIPIIAGPPIVVDGRPLVDGGMVQQIALKSALDAGATHVLVLMTRKEGELERPDQTGGLRLDQWALKRFYGARLAEVYRSRNAGINAVLQRIAAIDPDQTIKIGSVIRPADSSEVDRLTINADLLRRADQEARDAVFRYLER